MDSKKIWDTWGDGLISAGKAIVESGLFLEPRRADEVIFEHWSAIIEELLDDRARPGWRGMVREERVRRLTNGPLSYQEFSDTVLEGIALFHPGKPAAPQG